jgi:type I thyroxine 5'-deiodinase
VERLNEIYNEYKDKVTILGVYVSEAHPTDGRVSENNVKAGICFLQPRTVDERYAVAKSFIREMKFKMPLLLDTMDNVTAEMYGALPDRLVVIDETGAVAYAGAMGPHGFNPDAWLKTIRKVVA